MTPDAHSPAGPARRRRVCYALAAFAMAVLAGKFLLISLLGSMTPYKDQWGSEGYAFFAPLLSGTLPWYGIFAPHEEHRIVMTRLLDLGLLWLNGGIWNSLLEMTAGALLHVAALVFLLSRLKRFVAPRQGMLLLFATLLFLLPYDCGNTLWGFQSQIYFLLLFSFLSLWLFSQAPALSPAWWLAVALAVAACLSFASGLAVPAAALGLELARWRQPGRGRQGAAVFLLLLLTLLGLAATPAPPPNDTATASAFGVLWALLQTLSWPLPAPIGLLLYLPLLRFMVSLARKPAAGAPVHWFVLALGLWQFAQLLMISYGRADAPLATRYTDIFAVGVLLNFACLLHAGTSIRRLTALWLAGVLLALPVQTVARLGQFAATAIPYNLATERHVRAYLASGDPASLVLREFPGRPMKPSAAEMQLVLDVPAIRDMLPPSLVPDHAAREPGWAAGLGSGLHSLALALLTLTLAALLANRQPAAASSTDRAREDC